MGVSAAVVAASPQSNDGPGDSFFAGVSAPVLPVGWSLAPLGRLVSLSNGANAGKSAYGAGVPFINVLEVITHTHIRATDIPGRVQLDDVSVASFAVRRGDILFNRTSETQEEVGLSAVYDDDAAVVFGGFVIRGRIIDDAVEPGYLAYALRAPSVRSQIVAQGQGAIRTNIGQANLRRVLIPVPPGSEQLMIAQALSDVDGLLVTLGLLIAKKKAMKRVVEWELLTEKRRLPGFSDEWKSTKLGRVSSTSKGSGLSKGLVSESGTHKCILYGELFTTYGTAIGDVVSRTDSGEGVPSVAGDVLMPGSTTTVGADLAKASALEEGGVALGGDIIIVRPHDRGRLRSRFLAAFLTVARRSEIAQVTQGITIIHLYAGDLHDIPLRVPKPEEQDAILTILAAMEDEILALTRLLEKTRLAKQGMMQQLLTGRIRMSETA